MSVSDARRRRSYVDDIDGNDAFAHGEVVELDDVGKSKGDTKTRIASIDDLQEMVAQVGGDNQDGVAPTDDLAMVMDKIALLGVEDAKQILRDLLEEHKWDYNFSAVQKAKITQLLAGPSETETNGEWVFKLKSEAAICKFFSPYPEVRAVTEPRDDPELPCETIRAHLLGYVWACVAQFVNSLFNSRYPQITFTSTVAQILLYPCGKILAWILPDVGITIGGKRHSLNPGPWTYKEQMLSTIIIDVSLTSAYVFWNIQTQTVYYHDKWLTPGYKLLLLLSTQLMGLGFAGVLRRFVVYPTQTFWPSILPTLALNRALLAPDRKESIHGWTMSKYKFFFIVFFAMCIYFWLPGYLFQGLSYFAWITWISPNNFNLAVVTGSQLGMGFNPIPTFDWNVIGTYFYPLTWPFFAYVQQYMGQLLGSLIVLGFYYSNLKWTSYMPPNSSGIFDNTGSSYNITKVVNANNQLDEAAFKAYSPAFYSAGNLVTYGAFFAFYPLTFVFIILDEWRAISRSYRQAASAAWLQIKRTTTGIGRAFGSLAKGHVKEGFQQLGQAFEDPTSVYDGFDDPFTNMMRAYDEVPDWWFLVIILVSFIFAIILLTQYHLNTPVWTIFFVLGLNIVFLIPMTYLYAISGTTEGLNVVTELIVGYALPGNPEALMFVKAFGYNINGQADNYISDQKMGFYAKIPPRAMYRGQLFSSIITCFVCYGVVTFVDDIQGICTPDQSANFNCENGSQIYFSSSVVWGLIGPKRIFDQVYPSLKYAFLLGFLLALVWWTAKRFGGRIRDGARQVLPAAIFNPINLVIFTPISWLRDVHPSLILNGFLYLAPLNLSYTTMGLYLSAFFMYYIRRYKTAWFEKYVYVLSAALSAGVAFMAIIIFFAVQYNPKPLVWWGNEVIDNGVDAYAGQVSRFSLGVNETFGPKTWH